MESEESLSICITGEFCNLVMNEFFSLLATFSLQVKPCYIHAAIDMNKLENKEVIGKLYHTLDELGDFEFTLYERTTAAYDNIIVVNNTVAIPYTLNEHGNIDMCVIITDVLQVNIIYNRCMKFLHREKEVLMPKKSLGMEPFGFRDIFFTSNKYFYFLAHGFEFLLPDSVFQSLLENARNGMYKTADENWIRRIQSIWKNLMDKAELHILVPSNSLIRYLETGYIHLNDLSYQLTLDERKQHIQQILHCMKINENIHLGILLPASGMYSNNNAINLSFYSNYSSAFFKKNLLKIDEHTAPIYLINDVRLLTHFHSFFEEQTHANTYHEYTYEQLSVLHGKYKYLLDNLFVESEK